MQETTFIHREFQTKKGEQKRNEASIRKDGDEENKVGSKNLKKVKIPKKKMY